MFANREQNKYINYLEIYYEQIAPKLKEIDLLVKTMEEQLTIGQVSKALYITEKEVISIMKAHTIKKIIKKNFFIIMQNGSSSICRLYKRELEVGSPFVYTKEDISYIFDIDLSKVAKACSSLKINKITAYTLPTVFSHIYL